MRRRRARSSIEPGEPSEPNGPAPTAIVEAGYVPLWCSELIVGQLREDGIAVTALEEHLHAGQGPSMARIMCSASEIVEVQRVIDDLTTP